MNIANSPEQGRTIEAGGISTNYHDMGEGHPTLFIHGSGPGVTAWANWRLVLPVLATQMRVIAPDIVGFGYTERPAGIRYGRQVWVKHLLDFIDALGLQKVNLVGNSFGGALALAMAAEHPQRVNKLVLMGSVGVDFELTAGLDAVWGYQPSIANMKALLEIFAFNHDLVNDDLARMRFEASVRPGFQEAFASMFPEPRQASIDKLAVPVEQLANIRHRTLILHGQEDRVIPVENSHKLFGLLENAELHVFRKCGHWVQIEHAERFASLLKGFLCA
ncbi:MULTISPECIES: alpha/beta fold hydrolase [Pseudomonas]|jgi:pimeloyl-ACP methyl ester carboxylesterase|uniref:alpha/beta fold hydrolase n=1 Tax=Pseudomonas TaxID=286 RepID=UPI0002A1D3AF|nr:MULTISPECIES: alpha/beta hydrolase [Pseudomonas]MBB1608997.1 2-hydroxy-6-oxo-2,4-heptadienoate hydrolase [Pseudomonas sp. UMC76]MBB1641807.1 2-hydroxy-6-oxo-2,4-heptadienoate hydrolase [Pseudomonas sp. UME83]NTX89003.1 alpha/beta fold hydrolase [Pseudomonas sp. UMA643]NTY17522.1 alpha/beta fold hydrolase [Pseudomonas sp. UMC3103]NTY25213.1 alpha/beta fold hydrolase [Pseudomonas sp. UMA603]